MADEGTQTTTQTTSAITVPLNDDGTIGTLPDRLQKLIDSRISDAVKRAKADTTPYHDPVATERLRQLEAETQAFKVAEAERQKRYDEAIALREAEWKKTTDAQKAEIDRRTSRVVELLGSEIRAAATKHGARPESLDDLATIARSRVQLNDQLQAVVVGDDGKPTDKTIDVYVKELLEAKPYYRAASGGAGGGARGGASLTGSELGAVERLEAAKAKLGKNRTDPVAQREFLEAEAALKKAAG